MGFSMPVKPVVEDWIPDECHLLHYDPAMTHPISPVNEVRGENFKVRLLLAGVPSLHNVVGDLAASVVLRGIPGQIARVRFDV